jgi:hypothetical protein
MGESWCTFNWKLKISFGLVLNKNFNPQPILLLIHYIYIAAAVMCSESSNIGLVVLKSTGKCYARFTIYYYYTIDKDVTYCQDTAYSLARYCLFYIY